MKRALLSILVVSALWPAAAAAQPEASSDLRVRQDLVYARRGKTRLAMDAYLPPGERTRPAVIWLHGGQWKAGDKAEKGDVELAATIAEHGFVVFSANYRLWNPSTGKASYPEAVEDVEAAVAWVRDNAERFGVDPSRIAFAGNSSGAHLAALAATTAEGPASRVSAVVSFSGPMDLVPLLDHENEVIVEAVEGFLGCSGDECEAVAREASPVTHVDEGDPPMLLVNANEEVIPEQQARAMDQRLDAAGIESAVLIPSATQHGLGYMSDEKKYKFEGATATLPEIYLGFLGEHLGVDVRVQGITDAPPSVQAPRPSPKVAGGGGSGEGQEKGGAGGAPAAERSDRGRSGLIWVTAAAVIVAIVSLATTLLLLRRLRATPARPRSGDRGEARPLEPSARR